MAAPTAASASATTAVMLAGDGYVTPHGGGGPPSGDAATGAELARGPTRCPAAAALSMDDPPHHGLRQQRGRRRRRRRRATWDACVPGRRPRIRAHGDRRRRPTSVGGAAHQRGHLPRRGAERRPAREGRPRAVKQARGAFAGGFILPAVAAANLLPCPPTWHAHRPLHPSSRQKAFSLLSFGWFFPQIG